MANPPQFAYRTSKGIGIIEAAPVYDVLGGFERPEGNLRCSAYSPCGQFFAWASLERVTVVDASVGHVITTLPADNVFELGFSPSGTYIITWQRATKDENGDAVKNLKVWKVVERASEDEDGGEHVVGRFVQKSITGWNLQYTNDEQYCARVVTNEVQFYKSDDLGTVWHRIRIEGVTDFATSPGDEHRVAAFVPERKGQPAAVKIFNVPNAGTAVSQKTFFKGDKVQLKWNHDGTALIVLAQTEVDKSGKSYYGETTMYLLSADGQFDARITLDKDGPIHDVTWSPNSTEFGVVYGYMPAKTTLFNLRATPTYNFPLAPRNLISFSPNGRFVLVAGFGNLAGQMDIYDLQRDHQKLCTIQGSNASVCDWSPDGKYILTATTSPRLRVDNGVRIWHVGGGLMYNEDLQELYHVTWRPNKEASRTEADPLHPMPTPHESALKYLGTMKTPSKPAGAYRPPGARGQVTPIAFRREDEGGVAYVSAGNLSTGTSAAIFGKPRKREVPGAETAPATEDGTIVAAALGEGDEALSKAAAKNKKKREAKKAKDAESKATGLAPTAEGSAGTMIPSPNRSPERRYPLRSVERNRARGGGAEPHQPGQARSQERGFVNALPTNNQRTPSKPPPQPRVAMTNGTPQESGPQHSEPPLIDVTSPGNGGTPQDKKIRALLKKLRAIDDLKMRRAGGEKLEGTQIKKMATEDEVRRELEGLGWSE